MSGSPHKVLFIGHDATRTGAPLVLLHFLRWLRQNSAVEFEILLRQGGELLGDFQQLAPTSVLHRGLISKGEAKLVPRLRRKYDLNPSIAKQLERLYPRERFPLVYSNTITNGEFLIQFSRLGHRTLCHAHEMRYNIETIGYPHAKPAAGVTDSFIAASEGISRDLQDALKVAAKKITVIQPFGHPSVLTRETQRVAREKIRTELGVGGSDVVVGMCGAGHWRKGFDLFPQLAKTVGRLRPAGGYVFLWLGVDVETEEYQQMIHDRSLMGLEQTLKLIPSVSNPQDYLSAMDVFTLTSREDPFPLVCLEAAALGVPLVCFAGSGGAQDLIGADGGQVVPYLDIDAMAKAVLSLSEDDERRRQIGEVLRARVSDFTLETQAPKLLATIEENLRAV